MKKQRIDKLLVERGLAESREIAQAYLMAGKVLVNDQPITKAGQQVEVEAALRLKGEAIPFVGRGGFKLQGALAQFKISVAGKLCMDIGASTGGFTDVLLQGGASFVYAIDVGHNQLHYSLRTDPRVRCLEGVNFRHATLELTGSYVDLAVIDVSFISLTLILPPLFPFLVKGGQCVALVKPQFEAGREKVGKGGLVKDEKDRLETLEKIKKAARALGFEVMGEVQASIQGKKSGNQEWLLWLKKP